MTKDTEPQAFPSNQNSNGMSLRDYFAAPAMQGLLAGGATRKANMTIEVMKQALEALEEFCEHGAMLKPIERRDTLRQAIEQAEKQEPVAWVGLTKDEKEALSYKAEGNTWTAVELTEAKLKDKNT